MNRTWPSFDDPWPCV